jgi:hypothetical protein
MAKVSDRKDVVFYLGNESPRISRTLSSITGGAVMPPGTVYRLMIRRRESSDVVLDKPMQVSDESVYYDPVPGDFDEQGWFRAWVRILVGGSASIVQDVDEFDIVVVDHAPGYGVRTGAIARLSGRRVPVAWAALRARPGYGDAGLQELIDLTKLRWLPAGMSVSAAQEDGLDLRVTNFLALVTSIEVLKVAIEYWTGEVVSQTAVGSGSEVYSYPDRIKAAKELLELLEKDVAGTQAEAEDVLGATLGLSHGGVDMVDGSEPWTPGIVGPVSGYGGRHPWWCE